MIPYEPASPKYWVSNMSLLPSILMATEVPGPIKTSLQLLLVHHVLWRIPALHTTQTVPSPWSAFCMNSPNTAYLDEDVLSALSLASPAPQSELHSPDPFQSQIQGSLYSSTHTPLRTSHHIRPSSSSVPKKSYPRARGTPQKTPSSLLPKSPSSHCTQCFQCFDSPPHPSIQQGPRPINTSLITLRVHSRDPYLNISTLQSSPPRPVPDLPQDIPCKPSCHPIPDFPARFLTRRAASLHATRVPPPLRHPPAYLSCRREVSVHLWCVGVFPRGVWM